MAFWQFIVCLGWARHRAGSLGETHPMFQLTSSKKFQVTPPESWNNHIPTSYEISWYPMIPPKTIPLSYEIMHPWIGVSTKGRSLKIWSEGVVALSSCTKSLRTYEIPRAVCIYAVEPYGEGLYLAMKEQAHLETRSMSSLAVFVWRAVSLPVTLCYIRFLDISKYIKKILYIKPPLNHH